MLWEKFQLSTRLQAILLKKQTPKDTGQGKLTGEKTFEQNNRNDGIVGGRRKLIDQARFIENNTQAGHDGKIRISWIQVNSDIKKN